MAAVGTLTLSWRNGEDQFCIAKIGDLLALEDKCNAGISVILHRLQSGNWYLNDVRETIRLGLIGGGMPPEKAMTIVKLYVDNNPDGLLPSVLIAQLVLAAAIVGVPGEELGKANAAEAETGRASFETTAASAAPPPSASAPPSAGPSPTPTTPPSGNSLPPSRATSEPTQSMTTSPHL